MNARDELELDVLTEFGDPVFAEAIGVAYQNCYEVICALVGIEPIDVSGQP